jgi:hypothetical protein
MLRYSKACGSYRDFLVSTLTRKLLKKSSLRKCYGHHHDLVDRYIISVSQWSPICSTYRKHCTVHYSFTTYYWVCNHIYTTSVTNGSGSTDPSGAPEFTPVGSGIHVTRPFCFICMSCRLLFFLLYFSFSPLCCLLFDIRMLVSSNSS